MGAAMCEFNPQKGASIHLTCTYTRAGTRVHTHARAAVRSKSLA